MMLANTAMLLSEIRDELRKVNQVLELRFAEQIREDQKKRERQNADRTNFRDQILALADEMISVGRLEESERNTAVRLAGALYKGKINSWHELYVIPTEELRDIRLIGNVAYGVAMKIIKFHKEQAEEPNHVETPQKPAPVKY
jgi:hypothetical protein